MKEERITLFTPDIFIAQEKSNRYVLLSWQKPLHLFSQKFTQGLATPDTKGNVQLILSFSSKIQLKIKAITVRGDFHIALVSVFFIDNLKNDVIRRKSLKYVRFVLNEVSHIANIPPKLTTYLHKSGEKLAND